MATILAQVLLLAQTALPEDTVVNTFHFDAPATGTAGNALALALIDFYNDTGSAGSAIATFLSPRLSVGAGASHIKFYDATTPPLGSPFLDVSWTLGPPFGSAGPAPEEVALRLSVKGDTVAGGIAARRRGGPYIGPFNTTTLGAVDSTSRPDGGLITTMLDAAEALHDQCQTLGMPWCVYSAANDDLVEITSARVDNAWDTQRRRGAAATTRTVRNF